MHPLLSQSLASLVILSQFLQLVAFPFTVGNIFYFLSQIGLPWSTRINPFAIATPPLQFDFGRDLLFVGRAWAVVAGAALAALLFLLGHIFLGNRDHPGYLFLW
jgi:hypothetical protein